MGAFGLEYLQIGNSGVSFFSNNILLNYCFVPVTIPAMAAVVHQVRGNKNLGGTKVEWLATNILIMIPSRKAITTPPPLQNDVPKAK